MDSSQDRLDAALDFSSLFQAPAAAALNTVHACKAVADAWRTHYMATRERIEAEGHHARWEFSKQLLFERTNYAAEVRTQAKSQARHRISPPQPLPGGVCHPRF